jgi:hypothetical protein
MQHIISGANQLLADYHQIPAGLWQSLIATGILSPLIKVYKEFRITKNDRKIADIAMFSIVVAGCLGISIFGYLLTKNPINPKIILLHTAVLGFMTQPIYFALVKPGWKYLNNKYSSDPLIKELKMTSSIPAGGLPGTANSSSSVGSELNKSSDFSS